MTPRRGLGDPRARGAVWHSRLRLLADALGRPAPFEGGPAGSLAKAVERTVDLSDTGELWLALATLTGRFPTAAQLIATHRECSIDGVRAFSRAVHRHSTRASLSAEVRIVTNTVLVDVNHTVSTDLATGIQRVARETVRRWLTDRDCLPVAWTSGFGALRDLTGAERQRLAGDGLGETGGSPKIVVPWRSTLLVPELAAEHGRTDALGTLSRWSGNRTGVVGFDCVPLTSAETAAEGFASVFFGHLAALRHADVVTTISEAAAVEYEGWRRMLASLGDAGPVIRTVPLPEEAPEPDDVDLRDAHDRFVVPGMPLVLVVGSHEPRKNHLAVLQAALQRWREGDRFSLTFIGGNAWGSDRFAARLRDAQREGLPVESASRVPDRLLWAAYRLARFTVFPSLNEGFGLPAAESLAAGTPVITSRYGSMAEIARAGGAVAVDPRDDHDIADAMARLLHDDELLANLREQARRRPIRTWQQYADELWESLNETAPVTGTAPEIGSSTPGSRRSSLGS